MFAFICWLRGVMVSGLICLTIVGCDHERYRAYSMMRNYNATRFKAIIQHDVTANNLSRLDASYFIIANMPYKGSYTGNYYDRLHDILRNGEFYTHATKNRNGKPNTTYVYLSDISSVNIDSLIWSLDIAYRNWAICPWAVQYSQDQFKHNILPFRFSTEPLEYYWRDYAFQKYCVPVLNNNIDDPIVACRSILKQIDYTVNNLYWGDILQSFSQNERYKWGKCDDYAVYVGTIMRAACIPVNVEYIPAWGDANNGHAFNSMIKPDGAIIGFNNVKEFEVGLTLSGKIPKIYRKVFALPRKSILYKYKDSEFIPEPFASFDSQDVTENYDLPTRDITIVIEGDKQRSKIAYLTVFSPSGWKPVAWTPIKKQTCIFPNVGVGYLGDMTSNFRGESIGDGILYLAVIFRDGTAIPIYYPIIACQTRGPIVLKPDMDVRQSMELHRKFPRKTRIIDFAQEMVDGVFEASNRADFKDPKVLYSIYEKPLSHIQRIAIENDNAYRYVRYRGNRSLSISELVFIDKNGTQLNGFLIAHELLKKHPDLTAINDNTPLTYLSIGKIKDLWVGYDLGRPTKIGEIAFCPRTDDNDISPGDLYELFYWDNDWISLGQRTAEDYALTFRDVPTNALFWLRNLSKGKEERPFTYEHNAQIWW